MHQVQLCLFLLLEIGWRWNEASRLYGLINRFHCQIKLAGESCLVHPVSYGKSSRVLLETIGLLRDCIIFQVKQRDREKERERQEKRKEKKRKEKIQMLLLLDGAP